MKKIEKFINKEIVNYSVNYFKSKKYADKLLDKDLKLYFKNNNYNEIEQIIIITNILDKATNIINNIKRSLII